MAKLRVVESQHKDPPYARNTRVRGWKFFLDYERINQSDTWALSPPDMRPWLLMLWHTAWQQVPAGSFSDDDQVIAAKIGMDYRLFAAHKDILMRGWERYSDGRLYHPVIIEQVLNYQATSKREAERKAAWRAKQKQEDRDDVPRDRHGTDVGVTTPEPEPVSLLAVSSVSSDEETTETTGQNSPRTASGLPRVPFAKIVDLYHAMLPMLPRVEKLTQTRKGYIRQRWREDLPTVQHWENFFAYVAQSKFLTGQAPGTNGKPPFISDLEWLTKPGNFAKIAEEKYHRG